MSSLTLFLGCESRGIQRFISGIGLLLFAFTCIGGELDPLDERNAANNAMMTWFDVGAPAGHTLLIRRGTDRCVVRFTSFRRDHDAKPATSFNSGTDSVFAEYDWFYDRNSDGRENVPRYESGHRSLSLLATIGIGRLAFEAGNNEVICGPFRLVWFYPVRLGFNNRDSVKDIGVELAPTRWTTIEQVNFEDRGLRWYKVDESRKPTLIPMNKLP